MRKLFILFSGLSVAALVVGWLHAAPLPLPGVNGPYLGDQNNNLYVLTQSFERLAGLQNSAGLSVSQTATQAACTQLKQFGAAADFDESRDRLGLPADCIQRQDHLYRERFRIDDRYLRLEHVLLARHTGYDQWYCRLDRLCRADDGQDDDLRCDGQWCLELRVDQLSVRSVRIWPVS